MVRRGVRRNVDRAKFRSYLQVADGFKLGAAKAIEFEYWNAAGLLLVHAAIAYADALTIRIAGVKSQGEDHHEAIVILGNVTTPTVAQQAALRHLAKIIDHKNEVAYGGSVYLARDAEMLNKHLERFHGWVHSVIQADQVNSHSP